MTKRPRSGTQRTERRRLCKEKRPIRKRPRTPRPKKNKKTQRPQNKGQRQNHQKTKERPNTKTKRQRPTTKTSEHQDIPPAQWMLQQKQKHPENCWKSGYFFTSSFLVFWDGETETTVICNLPWNWEIWLNDSSLFFCFLTGLLLLLLSPSSLTCVHTKGIEEICKAFSRRVVKSLLCHVQSTYRRNPSREDPLFCCVLHRSRRMLHNVNVLSQFAAQHVDVWVARLDQSCYLCAKCGVRWFYCALALVLPLCSEIAWGSLRARI